LCHNIAGALYFLGLYGIIKIIQISKIKNIMKRSYVSYLMLAMVFLMAVVASCSKEGPAGPAGKDGVDGEDGIDGTDGTATCIQCHDDSQVNFSKTIQWAASIHATGGNFERNGTSCAPCHVSQGFLERMAAGTQETAAAVPDPNPVNCYTCHWIHATFEVDDYALTYADPVDYWHTGGKTVDADFGKGNLCSNCHQSRVVNPWPEVGSSDTYTITSYRYGPHHGPMSNVLGGFGGYEVPGSLSYANSAHTNIAEGCVTCHMASAYGQQAGGHSMNVGYEYHGHTELLIEGCIDCHDEGIGDATHEAQAEVEEMLVALGTQLYMMGRLSEDGYLIGDDGENLASSSNPATLSADVAGAYFNFKLIEEDRSKGMHNFRYTKALLTNSLESIQ
jgi:hypothetical protein